MYALFMDRVARWHPPTAAAVFAAMGLVVHEILYHLAGGDEYPLTVIFNDTRVFLVSHGGLDAAVVGLSVVSLLFIIDGARDHARRSR